MRILIAGNMGYIGPVVVSYLKGSLPNIEIHGLDGGFFAHCLADMSALPERLIHIQRFADVREVRAETLKGFDAVVQLAAVSNDPMGNQFEAATMSINRDASISLARAAAEAGVGAFVFASSCSVYGIAQGPARKETDPVAPETVYARSKVETESALRDLDTDMTITALRFATACGYSPRLRLDLVLNDFVAAALINRKIIVLSDGSPWRPLIDVTDMARAIHWAVVRRASQGGRFLIVNTGASSHNYQVRDLAEAVAAAIPGTEVSINSAAPVDSRSYQVDFGCFERLAPEFRPTVGLDGSIERLIAGITAAGISQGGGDTSKFIRLKVLQDHIAAGRLSRDLQWIN